MPNCRYLILCHEPFSFADGSEFMVRNFSRNIPSRFLVIVTMDSNIPKSAESRLRWLPAVVIVTMQWGFKLLGPYFGSDGAMYGMLIGGLGGGLAFLIWWLFFSRAVVVERVGALILMVITMVITPYFLHESMATAAMGMLFYFYAIPSLCLAFAAWAVLTRHHSNFFRRITMVVTIFVACGVWAFVRTGGFTNDGDNDFAWRWSPTAEENLLEKEGDMIAKPIIVSDASEELPVWPGYRGSNRNGVVSGIRIVTDWSESSPVELWRRSVGPGWSSFSVWGDLLYTQEQRGEKEVIACYQMSTGERVWMHGDLTRFWEANAGPGPRGTPAVDQGRLFALGATGVLNALDARDGSVIWSRETASDTQAKLPDWGFSSSPLVVDDLVIVAVSSFLVAYDRESGEPRWTIEGEGTSYSSPHLSTLGNVRQLLFLRKSGLISVSPSDGAVLWHHDWSGYPIVQPALLGDGDILISVKDRSGVRRLSVTNEENEWKVQERWSSNRMKLYYSDCVIHKGFAFGFDGSHLTCMDLNDGQRAWKDGRYGAGQLLLLEDQGTLLVLSEKGELILVSASENKFNEIARISVLKGKTWNHPVLVNDILLVRNAEEMAAFRLPIEAP